MTVRRNFERIYATEADPWSIGDADAPRYQAYIDQISPYAKGAVLDIGCGFGAFLAHFSSRAASLDGVEISRTAVETGKRRFPGICFHQGSAGRLDSVASLRDRQFDLIICSDVVYYLPDRQKRSLLRWIAKHLAPQGVAFIAAWSPGGKYLTPDQLKRLASSELVIVEERWFADSQHQTLICRSRRRLVAVTIDYETWQPIPEGKTIDWSKDVFDPTERLLELFDRCGMVATLFAEMGEYFWLADNEPAVARRMEQQWRAAVERGHDVQLHLHPSWLPELGASCVDGVWSWDWSKAKADDYPGDLADLIGRCKAALERAIRPVKPDFEVICFRAGAYQAQPFHRLSRALIANGIVCDSSVYPGGKSKERGFDYSSPYSLHQPYFANLEDPQLQAAPWERKLIEIPLFTPEPALRWFTDNDEAELFSDRLTRFERRRQAVEPLLAQRALEWLAGGLGKLGSRSGYAGRAFSALWRRVPALAGSREGDQFYVSIGHTKADLRIEALESNFLKLRDELAAEFVTMSEAARLAAAHLDRTHTPDRAGVARGPSPPWQALPWDVSRVLCAECAADATAGIASSLPWAEVNVARLIAGSTQREGAFDCIYVGEEAIRSTDVEVVAREAFRLLEARGLLQISLSLGANRLAKSRLSALRDRIRRSLAEAGFQAVDDAIWRESGSWSGAARRHLLIRAWKDPEGDRTLGRAQRAMEWLYQRITPGLQAQLKDPKRIIADGQGLCIAYAVALGHLLKREGFDVTWVTMRARGHERGRGPRREDSHEVLELALDGKRIVLDPMACTTFPMSFDALLREPSLADAHAHEDARGRERGYHLYNTSYWYERLHSYSRRRTPRLPSLIWTRAPRRRASASANAQSNGKLPRGA